MKTTIYRTIGLLILAITIPAFAENGLSWNGYLYHDLHLGIRDTVRYRGNELRLDLKAEAKPTGQTRIYAEFWVRALGQDPVSSISGLVNQNLDLNLREAYVDLYGTPFAKCDLRIGRQRIAWGTADKLNPTDNLNPPDFEDIWDFGRRLGSDALKVSFYPGTFTLTAVAEPFFKPAVLPRGDWASVFNAGVTLPAGLVLRNFSDSLILPPLDPDQSGTIGLKAARNILGYDLSFSYIYGRDHLPIPRRLTITPADTSGGVNVRSELEFPRIHIVGGDLAGSIGDIGVWVEAAVIMPGQEAVLTTDLSALGMGVFDLVIRPKEPFIKYVAGLDYTFRNGLYVNLQYLHGFVHENQKSGLEDYALVGLEWKLFADRLKIMPIAGGLEIKEFSDLKNNYALIYTPEVSWLPSDNAELNLGARWIEGDPNTTFGRAKGLSELNFRIKYSF